MAARIGILGGGAWGTALALVAARAGASVKLWLRDPELAKAMALARENRRYLPGIHLDPAIAIESALEETVAWAEVLLLVPPAQRLRALAGRLAPVLPRGRPLLLCCKGIEQGSLALPSEVLGEELPDNPALVLSGPNFAREVALGLPTAATLAGRDAALAEWLAAALGSAVFRPYVTDDLRGTEVGGALKNVIAIACGIVMGRGLGENARAALVTRGLAELSRLGRALGGRAETFMGLSGLGDLVLSCASATSRNYALGQALGEGRRLAEVLASGPAVVEGVATAGAAVALAGREGVELPISAAVARVMAEEADIGRCVLELLARPLKAEQD